MKNLQYLRYVWRHKRFVYQAGRILGVGRWQLLVHDWSKCLPSEWGPYRDKFYGPTIPPKGSKVSIARWRFLIDDRWHRAWLRHIHRNPHHWQHWVVVRESGTHAVEMPLRYVKEMVADWAGASRAVDGTWSIRQWYASRRAELILHPMTRKVVETLLRQWEAKSPGH